MFVRMLVSGVRSSCDASATRLRWAPTKRSSERASVDARGEAVELVAPVTSIRRERSAVRATSSAASVSRRTGASAERATGSPSDAAPAMPAIAIATRIVRSRPSVSSTSASGRATSTATRVRAAAM